MDSIGSRCSQEWGVWLDLDARPMESWLFVLKDLFGDAKIVRSFLFASKMDRRKTGFADISRVSAKLRMP